MPDSRILPLQSRVQLWDQVFIFLLAVCVVTEFKKGIKVFQQQNLGCNRSTET